MNILEIYKEIFALNLREKQVVKALKKVNNSCIWLLFVYLG